MARVIRVRCPVEVGARVEWACPTRKVIRRGVVVEASLHQLLVYSLRETVELTLGEDGRYWDGASELFLDDVASLRDGVVGVAELRNMMAKDQDRPVKGHD